MGFDIFALVWGASLLVKLVLVVLVILSATSWAIIIYKWWELAGASEDSEAFLEIYHEKPLEIAYDAARDLDRSPLAIVFLATCSDLKRGDPAAEGGQIIQRRLATRLAWMAETEGHRLERGLAFLATTGNNAPFIGLFGTVIGIIQAFQGIAIAGSASLAVVAPGIAEALIATAAGLIAAIPASIFYNDFAARIDEIRAAIDLFREEFSEDLLRMGTGGQN
ncbi:MAG: MotA/TolQ/ExbB proton channel family protein [Myxococcota bacterium]